eukprot:6213973-Pleurochrysis_carterae.AAC.1
MVLVPVWDLDRTPKRSCALPSRRKLAEVSPFGFQARKRQVSQVRLSTASPFPRKQHYAVRFLPGAATGASVAVTAKCESVSLLQVRALYERDWACIVAATGMDHSDATAALQCSRVNLRTNDAWDIRLRICLASGRPSLFQGCRIAHRTMLVARAACAARQADAARHRGADDERDQYDHANRDANDSSS